MMEKTLKQSHTQIQRGFLAALQERKAVGGIPLIPDIKCFSPKDGDLLRGRNPVEIARTLAAAGAPVLSVVTEEKEFGGSMELLREICRTVPVPVLRKDFIKDVTDLEETKAAGASAILLMYSTLGKEKLETLYMEALRIGLQPFVETHTAEELRRAEELGADLVGINNRNILQLERDDGDVSVSAGLLQDRQRRAAPGAEGFQGGQEQAFLVVESGLTGPEDVRRALQSGADGLLVGTAILQAPDPAEMFRAMTRPYRIREECSGAGAIRKCGLKICGIMDEDGLRTCLAYHPDMLGFVTEYPVPVPWNLSRERTEELLASVVRLQNTDGPAGSPRSELAGETEGRTGFGDKSGSRKSARTCIVTGGAPEKVITLARELRPDAVQLHYQETFEETARIAEALHAEGMQVIRSIPSDPAQRIRMFGTADLQEIFRKLEETAVDVLLLDSRDAGNAAKGGRAITEIQPSEAVRSALRGSTKELMIGGGLTAENIRAAVQTFRPDMADVMSGSETAPGRKSAKLIGQITAALNRPLLSKDV